MLLRWLVCFIGGGGVGGGGVARQGVRVLGEAGAPCANRSALQYINSQRGAQLHVRATTPPRLPLIYLAHSTACSHTHAHSKLLADTHLCQHTHTYSDTPTKWGARAGRLSGLLLHGSNVGQELTSPSPSPHTHPLRWTITHATTHTWSRTRSKVTQP